LFFKNALFHLFDVEFKSGLVGFKLGDGIKKISFEDCESGFLISFDLVVILERFVDVFKEFLEKFSDSLDSSWFNKHVGFSSGHLSEHSNGWSIDSGKVNLDTSLDKSDGVLGELDQFSFTGSQFVKDVEGTVDNVLSDFVIFNLLFVLRVL